MSLTPFGYITRIIGYIIMIVATNKLKEYESGFSYSQLSIVPLMCIAVYQGTIDIMTRLGMVSGGTIPDNIINITTAVFLILFHILLLLSISYLGKNTGLVKIRNAAVRNIVIMSVYFSLFIFMQIPMSFTTDYFKYLTIYAFIIQLIWTVLNIVLLLSCTKNICPEGEEDVPLKKSNFAFVNKFREEIERKEKKAINETVEYKKQKQKKRFEKYNNKRSSKKRK